MNNLRLILLGIILQMIIINGDQCPQLCQNCNGPSCQWCYSSFQSDAYAIQSYNDKCICPDGMYLHINKGKQYCWFCPIYCNKCQHKNTCMQCIIGTTKQGQNCIISDYNTNDWQFMLISYDLTDDKINDRQFNDIVLVDAILTLLVREYFTACMDTLGSSFLGGFYFDFNTQLFKTQFAIPYHQWAQIRFQFIAIDQWNDESIILQIASQKSYNRQSVGESPYRWSKSYKQQMRSMNLCGDDRFGDNTGSIDAQLEHHSSVLTMRITTSLYNQTYSGQQKLPNIYFGVREIGIRVGTCARNCQSCSSPQSCNKCKPNYKIADLNSDHAGQCICDLDVALQTKLGCFQKCAAGQTFLPEIYRCIACSFYISHCNQCSSVADCLECNLGFYLHQGKCKSQCSKGYRKQSMTRQDWMEINKQAPTNDTSYITVCIECKQGCQECGFDICQSCTVGYNYYKGQCQKQCPNGTYAQSGACKPCEENCAMCSYKAYCQVCKDDIPEVQLLNYYGKCIPSCADISRPSTLSCPNIQCDMGCLTCFGNTSQQCLSCEKTMVLMSFRCVDQCQLGYYSSSGVCYRCKDNCQECQNEICSSCQLGYLLEQSVCRRSCSQGYFVSDFRQCLVCNSTCSRCLDAWSCQGCRWGLHLVNGTCLDIITCPLGYYHDDRVGKCILCQDGCVQCFRDLCYSCQGNYSLNNGKCTQQCPPEKIKQVNTIVNPDGSTNTSTHCMWKNPLCEQYSSNSQSNCQACIYSDPKLVIIRHDQEPNYCDFICPKGFTKNTTSNLECIECPPDCYRCLENGVCLQCELLVLATNNSFQCVSECPRQYVQHFKRCVKCPQGCQRCHADGSCFDCKDSLSLKNDICVSSCPQKNFDKNGSCMLCDYFCLSCLGDAHVCTSCAAGLYLNGTNCLQECGSNYFADENNNRCSPCAFGCQQCSHYDYCNKCKDNFKWFQDGNYMTCIEQCPSGYFPDFINYTYTCQRCASNCHTCYGLLPDQCLTCPQNLILHHTKCINQCPLNRYEDQYGHCDWCHQSCKKCFGPASFQCLQCNNNYSLYMSQCWQVCPGATYLADTQKGICEQCQWGCGICISPTDCSLCHGGFYLYKGLCYSKCPKGTTWKLASNAGLICVPCADKYGQGCSQCSQFAGCTRCNSSSYYHQTAIYDPFKQLYQRCLTSCHQGTYQSSDSSVLSCLPCPNNCKSCISLQKCTTCNQQSVLNKHTCSKQCPLATYYSLSGSNASCLSCSDNCKRCKNYTICDICDQTYYKVPNNREVNCKGFCPQRYFLSDKQCQKCTQNCKSCTNFSSCTSCDDDYVYEFGVCRNNNWICQVHKCSQCRNNRICETCMLPYLLLKLDGTTTCQLICPQKYYQEGRQCVKCHSYCQQCTSDTYCLVCRSGLIKMNGICVQQCPNGTYANTYNLQCQPCLQGCLRCSDPYSCQQCRSYMKFWQGECLNDCPIGSYYSLSDLMCFQCRQGCLDCSQRQNCTQCEHNLLLFDGQCLIACPSMYFSAQRYCLPCQKPCQTCIDGIQCTTCVQPYILNGTICQLSCAPGYLMPIYNTTYKKCQPCSSNCLTCSIKPDLCDTCAQGVTLFNQKCVAECPLGTHLVDTSCRKCSNYCLKCSNYSACTTCHDSMVLFNKKCIISCPKGYYAGYMSQQASDNSTNICIRCVAPCQECIYGSSYQCTSCISGFLFIKRCVIVCPSGFYGDPQLKICLPCSENCLTCSSSVSCFDCNSSYKLSPTTACVPIDNTTVPICNMVGCHSCNNSQQCLRCKTHYYLHNQSCVQNCPPMYYNSLIGICQPCSGGCLQCDNHFGCRKCQDNVYLFRHKCVMQCPINTVVLGSQCTFNPCLQSQGAQCFRCLSPFLLQNTVNGSQCVGSCAQGSYRTDFRCVDCSSGCIQCTSSDRCLNCSSEKLLYNGECVLSCPNGKISNDAGKCIDCPDPKCQVCTTSINGPIQCTACSISSFTLLFNGSCVFNCPQSYYKDTLYRQCKPCQQQCATCINAYSCSSCPKLMDLVNGQCTSNCLQGYYLQNTTCKKCVQGCDSCTSQSNCKYCVSGYLLWSGICWKQCPASTYSLNSTHCQRCVSPCLTCISSDECTSCSYMNLQGSKCIQECPAGSLQVQFKLDMYQIIASNDIAKIERYTYRCQQCSSFCKECTNSSTICKKCHSGYELDTYMNCVQNCTSTHVYFHNDTHDCLPCSEDCQSCYGPLPNQCINCPQPLVLYASSCVLMCPNGMYHNHLRQCKTCDLTKCLFCAYSKSNCTLCHGGLYLYNGQCLQVCPLSYRGDDTTRKCVGCDPSCVACQQKQSNIKCNKCQMSKYLYLQQCIEQCPYGFAPSHPQSELTYKQCIACGQYCQKCSIIMGTTQPKCQECTQLGSLYEGKCVQECPQQTYRTTSNNQYYQCTLCDVQGCASCQLSVSNMQCTTCLYSYLLVKDTKKCVRSCPQGYHPVASNCQPIDYQCKMYQYGTNCIKSCPYGTYSQLINTTKYCQQCPLGCQECISSNQCTVCHDYYLQYQNSTHTQCVKQCPTQHYKRNGICLQCDETCTSCFFAGNEQTCLSCKDNYTVWDGRCVQGCGVGTYSLVLDGSMKCLPCATKCRSCQSASECTVCKNTQNNPPLCEQQNCQQKQYKGSSSQCLPCHSSCQACFGQNFDECTLCKDNQTLIEGICETTCPPSYSTNPGICQPCEHTKCLSCLSPDKCLKCESPYMLALDTCVLQCSSLSSENSTYYQIGLSCELCSIANCADCRILNGVVKCAECANNSYRYNDDCLNVCPQQTQSLMLGYQQVCVTCPNTCQTCNYNEGSNILQCNKCKPNLYFSNGQCISPSCAIRTYPSISGDDQTLECIQCSLNCLECSASGCTACIQPYLLSQQSCNSSCIQGYYMSGTLCVTCNANCRFCNSSSCLDCYQDYYLFQNTCQSTCPNEYYPEHTNNKCQSCSPNCTLCYNRQKCQQCSHGYLFNSQCTPNCPVKTYLSHTTCQPCPINCQSCQSASNCTACTTPYVLSQASCLSKCPTGLTKENQTCVPCLLGCKQCESGLTSCTLCEANVIPDSDGSCVVPSRNTTNCSDGKFVNTFKQCSQCSSSCKTCYNAQPTGCLTCQEPQFKLQKDGSCLATCNIGQFMDSNNLQCQACQYIDSSCLQCNSTACFDCGLNKIVNLDGRCQTNCPLRTYTYNQECKSCPNLCVSCSSYQSCSQCDSGALKYNSLCYDKCPWGSYLSNSSCAACSSKCILCSSSAENCSSCNYPYNIDYNNNSCVELCPVGTYGVEEVCVSCGVNCTACYVNGSCSKCTSYLHNGTCTGKCPDGYVGVNMTCMQCLFPCQSCSIEVTNCTTCNYGYILNSNQCTNECPPGQYLDSDINSCQNCQTNNCKLCTYSECFNCLSGYYFDLEKQCVDDCGDYYFKNIVTGTCTQCPQNCKNCSNSSTCQVCDLDSVLFEGQQCRPNCPIKYFQTNRKCQDCSMSCNVCTSSQNCTQCLNNYFLLNEKSQSKCVDICPQKYYTPHDTSGKGQCKKCLEYCIECNQNQCLICDDGYSSVGIQCRPVNCVNCTICNLQHNCQQCETGLFLMQNVCQTFCPQGYYGNESDIATLDTTISVGVCLPCMQNCQVCPNSYTCDDCIQGYGFTLESGCIDEAIIQFGVFANMSTFTSNMTKIVATVYLSTSVGPMVFGQMTTTYFNIQFCQFVFFHDAATGGNPEMQQFLNSLQVMSLTTQGSESESGSRRMLSVQQYRSSFLQTNASIFAMMGCFLSMFITVLIFQKYMNHCCSQSPKLFFYMNEICNFMQKRFKWIYFDFIMWISFLPFIFFAFLQLKNFNFDTFAEGFSSLLSIAIIVVYPAYPFFICYLIKSQYNKLCVEGADALVEMSLSPYMYKVRRPAEIPQQGQSFKYMSLNNFRIVYVPLEYLRKFLFIMVIVISTKPITTVSVLICLNIIFISYIIAIKPRVMPFLAFDLVVEFVLLSFQMFMLVYLSLDGAKIAAMSIVAHAVGFITANLSLIVAIVLNLYAYYKIFMCIYELINHLRDKADQKQKMELKDGSVPPEMLQETYDEKSLGGGARPKIMADDNITEEIYDEHNRENIDLLDEKQIIYGKAKQIRKDSEDPQIPQLIINDKSKNRHHQNDDNQVEEGVLKNKQASKFKRDIGNDFLFVQKGRKQQKTSKYQRSIPVIEVNDSEDVQIGETSSANLKFNARNQQKPDNDHNDMLVIDAQLKDKDKTNNQEQLNVATETAKDKQNIEGNEVIQGIFKDRNLKGSSNQQQPSTHLDQAITHDRIGKTKTVKHSDNSDLQQGKMKEHEAKNKNTTPQEQFDDFLEENKSTEFIVAKDRNITNKHPRLKKQSDENEDDVDNLNQAKMKDKNRNTNQHKNSHNKLQQECFQVGNAQIKQRVPNKFQRNINNQESNGDNSLQEAQFKNLQTKRKNNNNSGNSDNFLRQGDMMDRQAKQKKNIKQRHSVEQDIQEIGTYDHKGKTKEKGHIEKATVGGYLQEGELVDQHNRKKPKRLQNREEQMQHGQTYDKKHMKARRDNRKQFVEQVDSLEVGKAPKKREMWGDNNYEDQDYEKKQKKEMSKRRKDNLMNINEPEDQSYENVVRKNKRNIIQPPKEDRKINVLEEEDFEEQEYSRPKSKIQKIGYNKDQGLGVMSNNSGASEDDTQSPKRRYNKSVILKKNMKSNFKINDKADKFQEDSIKNDIRKQSTIVKKPTKKLGVLKIDDNSEDEKLDSIQL